MAIALRSTKKIKHQTIVEGDAKYMSIAAASVLAKTYRDDFMIKLHKKFPDYDWENNKGYGTEKHVTAISKNGYTCHHRMTFVVKELQPQPAEELKSLTDVTFAS